MSKKRLKRIKNEYRTCTQTDQADGTAVALTSSAEPVTDASYEDWTAAVYGPPDCPYDTGVFFLKISFPDKYPFEAPKVKFITPIYHMNIDEVCVRSLCDVCGLCVCVSAPSRE